MRLAQEFVRDGLPVILVTRSLRWIPASANALRELPWVTPDAGAAEVSRAVGEAMADGHMPRRARRTARPAEASPLSPSSEP